MKLRPDLLWYHGIKPYCGYNRKIAYNPSRFGDSPLPYYDWYQLIRGDLAATAFDTLGQYRACVHDSFGMWTQGDGVLNTLKQQGQLINTNRDAGITFLPGYVLRNCSLNVNEFCFHMTNPQYFANGEAECNSVLHTC